MRLTVNKHRKKEKTTASFDSYFLGSLQLKDEWKGWAAQDLQKTEHFLTTTTPRFPNHLRS
jgi:hypothetical protein